MLKTHIVQSPLPFLKMGDTENPISFQLIEFTESSEVPFWPHCWPESLSRQDTKSDGVIPSLACDLTEATKFVASPNSVSASVTCSLGLLTEYPQNLL